MVDIMKLFDDLYSDDEETRRAAINKIDELGIDDAYGDLIELYEQEGNILTKLVIIHALRHSNNNRVVSFLREKFDEEDDDAIKWMILKTFQYMFPDAKDRPFSFSKYIVKNKNNTIALVFAKLINRMYKKSSNQTSRVETN